MTRADNLRGILWMIFGMAGFALHDMFLKLLAGAIPTGQLLVFMGLGASSIFLFMALRMRVTGWLDCIRHPVVLLRTAMEAGAAAGFVMALSSAPLSAVSTIIQSNPLLVTLGAAIWFREPVGPHRWAAIMVGLFGVLLVIRPWDATFEPGLLYAVVGVFFLSMRDLLARRVPPGIPTIQLGVFAMLSLVPAGLLLHPLIGADLQMPDRNQIFFIIVASALLPIGFFGTTAAMRSGDIGAVTPFRYIRIVMALILAAIVFGERPDALTYAGAGIIVASGLYTLWREQIRRVA